MFLSVASFVYSSAQTMEAIFSYEMLVKFQQTTWRRVSNDLFSVTVVRTANI
jgi:hypothetical protein